MFSLGREHAQPTHALTVAFPRRKPAFAFHRLHTRVCNTLAAFARHTARAEVFVRAVQARAHFAVFKWIEAKSRRRRRAAVASVPRAPSVVVLVVAKP